jgi:hypothetical protein
MKEKLWQLRRAFRLGCWQAAPGSDHRKFLLESGSAAGWYGLFTRTLGSQIRGGKAAALFGWQSPRLSVCPTNLTC